MIFQCRISNLPGVFIVMWRLKVLVDILLYNIVKWSLKQPPRLTCSLVTDYFCYTVDLYSFLKLPRIRKTAGIHIHCFQGPRPPVGSGGSSEACRGSPWGLCLIRHKNVTSCFPRETGSRIFLAEIVILRSAEAAGSHVLPLRASEDPLDPTGAQLPSTLEGSGLPTCGFRGTCE